MTLQKLPGVKPEIGTVAGTAKYIGTETEDKNGKWNDSYATKDGYWVIHSGEQHHVYKVSESAHSRIEKLTEALGVKTGKKAWAEAAAGEQTVMPPVTDKSPEGPSAVVQGTDEYEEGRKYISDAKDAPKGAAVKRGPHGGMYYDTKDSGSTAPAPKKEEPKKEEPKSAIPEAQRVKNFQKDVDALNKKYKIDPEDDDPDLPEEWTKQYDALLKKHDVKKVMTGEEKLHERIKKLHEAAGIKEAFLESTVDAKTLSPTDWEQYIKGKSNEFLISLEKTGYGKITSTQLQMVRDELLKRGVNWESVHKRVEKLLEAKGSDDKGPFVLADIKRKVYDPHEYSDFKTATRANLAVQLGAGNDFVIPLRPEDVKKGGFKVGKLDVYQPVGEESLKESGASRVMELGDSILTKHKSNTGADLLKEPMRSEFKAAIKPLLPQLTSKDLKELENENYHSEVEILMQDFGMKMGGY